MAAGVFTATLTALAVLLLGGGSAATAASEGRTLIELTPKTACDAAGILRQAGAAMVSSHLRLYTLDERAAASVLPRLRTCKAVRYTGPDRPAGTLSTTDFADPLVPSQWWRAAIGVANLVPPAPGRPVTIIDSGVELDHPEFVGWPTLTPLNEQQPQPIGGVHGTAVASLIGAPINGVGIVGVYPQAVVQSWDSALGRGTELSTSDIVAGVLAASARGPGVINLSLGGSDDDLVIRQAIATAVSKGMLVVAASGNDGDAGNPLTYPASLPHVLTVGASGEQNRVVPFSSQSRFIDLVAPGENMTVASAIDRSWGVEDGTSFAAPLVSGAAAWVWTVRPKIDAGQLFEIMSRSATDIGPPGRDDASGFGVLNVPAALAYPSPVKDPLEPNDDIDYLRPGARFFNGIPALTTASKRSIRLAGRLAAVEDPRDLYRVFVPARGRLTVKTTAAAAVDLSLWSASAASVTAIAPGKDRLARGATKGGAEILTYNNPGAATTAYLAVTMGTGNSDATYLINVAAR